MINFIRARGSLQASKAQLTFGLQAQSPKLSQWDTYRMSTLYPILCRLFLVESMRFIELNRSTDKIFLDGIQMSFGPDSPSHYLKCTEPRSPCTEYSCRLYIK